MAPETRARADSQVLDATGDDGETIGPLFQYGDPKRPSKILGRDLLDGAVIDRDPPRDGKKERANRFYFTLAWPTDGTERQLYANSARARTEWCDAVR